MAGALFENHNLVRVASGKNFSLATRPLHFDPFIPNIVGKPNMHARIILRNEA
jgi:hypothetical protein